MAMLISGIATVNGYVSAALHCWGVPGTVGDLLLGDVEPQR
jgi:hypothetical protein